MPGDFGAVAFYDATNATAERRRWLMERVKPSGAKVIFIESICTDEAIVSQNIMAAKVGIRVPPMPTALLAVLAYGRTAHDQPPS
jgi:hypothetical protein